MFLRKKFLVRFHLLPTFLLTALVIALTVTTVSLMVARFESTAEESARTVFSLIAQRNADQLQDAIEGARSAVQTHLGLESRQLRVGGRINQDLLVPMLTTAVRVNPRVYSFYFGFANEEFLQVIGVRRDARIAQALGAPASTFYALHVIDVDPAHPELRNEHWGFHAENGTLLARAENRATFTPSQRPWYAAARASPELQMTEPYRYESLRAMGITLSQAMPDGPDIVGADVALRGLDQYAESSLEGREGGIAVTDPRGHVLAAHATPRFLGQPVPLLEPVSGTANPFFTMADTMLAKDGSRIVSVQGNKFAYASRSVTVTPTQLLHVVAFAPMSLYAGPIKHARDDIVRSSALLLLVFLPLAWLASRRIAGTLAALTGEAERIQRLDFSGEKPVASRFYEIDMLGRAQHTMKTAIRERTDARDAAMADLESLVKSGVRLSARRSREKLLEQTVEAARRLVGARTGQFWLENDAGALQLAALSGNPQVPAVEVPLPERPVRGQASDPCAWVAQHRQPLLLDGASEGFDLGMQSRVLGQAPHSLLAVPVLAHDKLLGVLVLVDAKRSGPPDPSEQPEQPGGAAAAVPAFAPGCVRFAQTLAAQAGIALENITLLRSQRELMESLIQLIAGAIDAKSPYTGGHCARVPELARMLAEEACAVDKGPLADFRFDTEEEWGEFRVGTWLHDCGKVTTPEYVVDKATKLETIYNRVHEIRTRFEVLLRDAEIERLQAVAAGGDAGAAARAFEARRTQLADDFAFVAHNNIGSESTAPENRERLARIAETTWLRHFDDRLGLSHVEEARLRDLPAPTLPVAERLLADKPQHVIARTAEQRYDPRYGFRMDVPEHLYNFGELYNLCIERGTLTAEERYKINEHIVQTIVMLDQLPLPAGLSRVPEYAGTHHESLRGSGYPRRLGAAELSVPARIMAIADVFEALTASDRPYKKAKPLSEAVHILWQFKRDGHIDADIFDLFLRSGLYLRYAEQYLAPEQIDAVDIGAYLG
ncbi:MAG: HD domain-containing phosphohydrolase [Pseudomonadota bacterium]